MGCSSFSSDTAWGHAEEARKNTTSNGVSFDAPRRAAAAEQPARIPVLERPQLLVDKVPDKVHVHVDVPMGKGNVEREVPTSIRGPEGRRPDSHEGLHERQLPLGMGHGHVDREGAVIVRIFDAIRILFEKESHNLHTGLFLGDRKVQRPVASRGSRRGPTSG
jgi:hypothetical protein